MDLGSQLIHQSLIACNPIFTFELPFHGRSEKVFGNLAELKLKLTIENYLRSFFDETADFGHGVTGENRSVIAWYDFDLHSGVAVLRKTTRNEFL